MAQPFTIRAGPDTDIWKKPPAKDIFNAPFKTHSSNPVAKFRSAQVTFTAAYAQQYDQAGLLFRLTPPTAADQQQPARKWVKTGVELYEGLPRLSTVSCDTWADWSVGPVDSSSAAEVAAGKRSVTVRVRAEGDANGRSWWVYHIDGETETPLREICWIADARYAGWTLEVAALVARPAKGGEGELEAKFEDFTVEWA
ncbi:hypothetical protein ISF_08707 [Cordyceps fumosorosea ARSEF 2679]|uniref:Concanavalin A-like lectin/glucanase n=1 Tax=Cordyceps fumosorosea (strain ARSEF 2679) TaxID=1081104 RepID=A0A167LV27_CORFA|nr:hypothetical protein ISF_08707 [Cordyceps fumosorosea ARSEF 2679]OAA53546.1 hypothetical protein ISF_08707 [Cordyceps fumosorosea ARSEF 2679]